MARERNVMKQFSPWWLANALLAALCLVLVVLVVQTLMRDPAEPQFTNPVGSMQVRVPAWNWFSRASVTGTQQLEEPSEEYDELDIQAELTGVIITPEGSSATIRVGREEKVLTIGDELQSGIEVTRIEATRVVVSSRGRTLQLSFPEPEGGRTATVRRQPGNGLVRETGQEGFNLPNVLSAEPVEVGGYSGGFRLSSIPGDVQNLTNIRNDDIVVQIGTQDIQSLLNDPAQWVGLSTETALPVTLIRDGKEQVIYVNALSLSARLLPRLNQD